MSDTENEWQTEDDAYRPDEGAEAAAPMRRRRMNYLGWLLSLSGIAWLLFFVIFVARSIGWSLVPELLPHEIGGLVAGLLVPPAILFALASLTSRRQRLGDMLTALEGQVARLETPFTHANSELSELGEMLVLYGQALEESVNDARAHLQELRGGFGREAAELEAISSALRALMVNTNEAAGDQAEQLAQMTAQVSASLAEIREIGHGEAAVIDDASRRAAEVVRELVTTLGDQIEAIEAGFQDAVSNTVGRVAGAGDAAASEYVQ
jgi:methyl-accepting chemotaxis protein